MAVLFFLLFRFQRNRTVFLCYPVFCFLMNVGTFSSATRDRTLSASLPSAVDTKDDDTLFNATQQFDLNFALYNSIKSNIETCRYVEMNNPFPITALNKSLFLFTCQHSINLQKP